MVNERKCLNCGSTLSGRVDKEFCSDKCRKYYRRHGNVSLSGIRFSRSADSIAEKDGQDRTSTSGGGNSVGSYFMKRLIDLGQKVAENKLVDSQKHPLISPKTDNRPLQIQSAALSTSVFGLLSSPKVKFNTEFSAFLGEKVSFPFKMLVWGLPGSGKSTFCMRLADQIAINFRILYIAGEELLTSDTLREKQNRSIDPRNRSNCIFLNRLPNSEAEWKGLILENNDSNKIKFNTIFYDSVTKLGITPFYVDALAHDTTIAFFSTHLSHIFITHAHKDGQMYRGDGSWAHEVDIIIKCEKGTATTEKNRFGETGKEFKIY